MVNLMAATHVGQVTIYRWLVLTQICQNQRRCTNDLEVSGFNAQSFKLASAKIEPLKQGSSAWKMGVSKNRGTSKWMVYNGKPYQNGWFGGTPIFGNTQIYKTQTCIRDVYTCTHPTVSHCPISLETCITRGSLKRYQARRKSSKRHT